MGWGDSDSDPLGDIEAWIREAETAPEFYRTSGDMVCECGATYREHPWDQAIQGFDGPFLRVICNGDRVKL